MAIHILFISYSHCGFLGGKLLKNLLLLSRKMILTQSFSTFLNLSRWLAAFLVVIAHVRHLVFVDLKLVSNPSLVIKGLYFFTGFGHESVVIFFVISGFLVGGLSLQKWQTKGVNLLNYSVARVSRIYTVLIPALLLGAALDLVGLHWFNASALYTESPRYQSSMNSVIMDNLNAVTLLGNLAMLQNIVTACLGSNAPLWSLAYEWWYYCIFALLGTAVLATGKKQISAIACLLVLVYLLPNKIILWMIIWALGVLAALWVNTGRWVLSPTSGTVLFVIALVISRLSHNIENVDETDSLFNGFWRDFGLGLAYTVLIAAASKLSFELPGTKFQKLLADFSYSTYLFHFPVMVFLAALAYELGFLEIQVQPNFFGALFMFALVGITYMFCYIFYLLFERHTDLVRGVIFNVVKRGR